jgi:hypothetical protein
VRLLRIRRGKTTRASRQNAWSSGIGPAPGGTGLLRAGRLLLEPARRSADERFAPPLPVPRPAPPPRSDRAALSRARIPTVAWTIRETVAGMWLTDRCRRRACRSSRGHWGARGLRFVFAAAISGGPRESVGKSSYDRVRSPRLFSPGPQDAFMSSRRRSMQVLGWLCIAHGA